MNAARMISDGFFARNLQQRYISYKSGFGEKLDKGSTTFEECEDYIRKCGECQPQSSRQEHFENMFNYYVYPSNKYDRYSSNQQPNLCQHHHTGCPPYHPQYHVN